MGYIVNEKLNRIGEIDNRGYVYDTMGDRFAQITDSGYITAVAGWDTYGKIDEDGTIRDASMNVIGRIQADGYIYIHSERVGTVSSDFIEKITPYAWNAGQSSTYAGRNSAPASKEYNTFDSCGFLFSPFFIKIIIGIILGIIMMVEGAGGPEMLVSGPICVFLFSFIYKIFN